MHMLNEEQKHAVELLRQADIHPEEGLPEPLFLLISSLVPLPNVDLLISDESGRLLLSRRNDRFLPKSWHIPGGCMRYGEDFQETIQKTALRELGCKIEAEEKPLTVQNLLRKSSGERSFPRELGHNVAVLFRCRLPEGYCVDRHNAGKTENEDGYLRWFDALPSDFLETQLVYGEILRPWTAKKGK